MTNDNRDESWWRVPGSTPAMAPNGERIIVCVQIAFEHYVGPTIGTRIASDFPKEELAKGKRDLIGLSWQDYGVNAGIHRLLNLLKSEGIPGTIAMSGLLAERCPEIAKRIIEDGNEICAHSWGQDVKSYELEWDAEEENVLRCAEAIEVNSGRRPVGWVSPGGQLSHNLLEILASNGFTYSLDFKDDDVPYMVKGNGWKIVAIPNPYDINDIRQYARAGNGPSTYVEIFSRTFDCLYEEGATQPKIINAIVHPPLYGRPFGWWALREVIRYAKSFNDVWFATRSEVADWVLRSTDSANP